VKFLKYPDIVQLDKLKLKAFKWTHLINFETSEVNFRLAKFSAESLLNNESVLMK
jgi:hypothetical protein